MSPKVPIGKCNLLQCSRAHLSVVRLRIPCCHTIAVATSICRVIHRWDRIGAADRGRRHFLWWICIRVPDCRWAPASIHCWCRRPIIGIGWDCSWVLAVVGRWPYKCGCSRERGHIGICQAACLCRWHRTPIAGSCTLIGRGSGRLFLLNLDFLQLFKPLLEIFWGELRFKLVFLNAFNDGP